LRRQRLGAVENREDLYALTQEYAPEDSKDSYADASLTTASVIIIPKFLLCKREAPTLLTPSAVTRFL
jgi:hypothetical protein